MATGTVVIVGGGVVGCFCGYYLQQKGYQVTIIDQGTIGGACSHGNCGYICPSHVLPLAAPGAITSTLKTLFQKNSALKVRFGYALRNLGWFLRFARLCNRPAMMKAAVGIQALLNSSRTLYEELLKEHRDVVEWDTHGLMFVYQTAKAFEHYAEINDLLSNEFAMPAERMEAQEILEREPALKPGSVSGGYLYPNDVQIRPDKLMTWLRQSLEQSGVTFVEQCQLHDIASQKQDIRSIHTTQGNYSADQFVFATGALTAKFASLLKQKIPIIPGKGYSMTMPTPSIAPKYPMIFEEHRVAVSPFASGLRIGSTMEFAGYDDSMNPARLQLLRDCAEVYLRDPGSEATEEWWGWRPMIADGKPIIDRSQHFGNAYIAAGHGMLGVSMAPSTGKLLAEMLHRETPFLDPQHYSGSRFG